MYALPIEDWSNLTRKELSSNLHIFDGQVVSILRNDREVYIGYLPGLIDRHSETHWLRVEIDVSGELRRGIRDLVQQARRSLQGVRDRRHRENTIGSDSYGRS